MKPYIIILFTFVHTLSCRDQMKNTFASLDTDLRSEERGAWKVISLEAHNIQWRLISYSPHGQQIYVSGGYRIQWKNENKKPIVVDYGVRFVDQHGFVIAQLASVATEDVKLGPKELHTTSQPFFIIVDNLTAANKIRSLELFIKHDGQTHAIHRGLRIVKIYR